MSTQKAISTITYNSESFLTARLEEWLKAHWISEYMFIAHKGEDGGKDHIHLRIEPNRRLDPMDLQELLHEYTPTHQKPLGCMPWKPSDLDNWICYVLHDEDYLKSKYGEFYTQEDGKIPYSTDDIKCSEGTDPAEYFRRAKTKLKYTAPNMLKGLQEGKSAVEYVQEGVSPYAIRGILGVLQASDYEHLAATVHELGEELELLKVAIDRAGFVIVADDEGFPELEPKPKQEKPLKSHRVIDGKLVIAAVSQEISDSAIPEQFVTSGGCPTTGGSRDGRSDSTDKESNIL